MRWSDRGLRRTAAVSALSIAALAMSVAASAQPGGAKNLLVNGDAEQGEASATGYEVVADIPGWTRRGKFTVAPYGAPNGFPGPDVQAAVSGGANFFAGGPSNPGSALSQTVDVATKAKAIDGGKAKATLSGYLGGYATQDDALIATAVFLRQSGSKLGPMLKIGPVRAAQRSSQTAMLKKAATVTIPKGTRSIRVTITASRTSGDYNDGYADNLSLTVTP